MPEHKLPVNYARIDENIAGPVLDSIEIHPRSRGVLYLPGQYSASSRPPAHQVKTVSSAPDGQGVHAEPVQRGTAERYTVSYDVTNQRDSIAFAHLIRTGQPDNGSEDTPGG